MTLNQIDNLTRLRDICDVRPFKTEQPASKGEPKT